MSVEQSIPLRPATAPRPPRRLAPGARPWKVWGPVVLLALVGVGVIAWIMVGGRHADEIPASSQFFKVVRADLDVKIIKTGELAAVNNIDILSQVEGQTTIQQIVPEGSSVTKGQPIVVLDSSALKLKLEDSTLDLQKAEADMTAATEMRDIQESQNAANLEAATVALSLARLDWQQYTQGSYPQQLQTAKVEVEMAQTLLKNKEEDLDQTRRLFAKSFVTGADVKKGELDVLTARNDLQKKQTALLVLEKYTHEMDLASKKNAVAQAEQKLARIQKENASNMSQKVADVQAKTQARALMKRRVDRLTEQLAACTLFAPEDGLVVYASSMPEFRGRDSSIIQEGAQVRERQLIVRLPDVRQMKAIVKIPEARISQLALGMRAQVKIIGVPKLIGATVQKISPVFDSSNRWLNPDVKEYPIDLVLDETPAGHKPGESAECEILLERLPSVLPVRLEALYASGKDSYLFVKHGKKLDPAKVEIGAVTEDQVEIKSGVQEGDEVLVLSTGQGRELLQKAGISVEPASQPARFASTAGTRPAFRIAVPSTSDSSREGPRRRRDRNPEPE